MPAVEATKHKTLYRVLWEDRTWSDEIVEVAFDPKGRWAKDNNVPAMLAREMIDKNRWPRAVDCYWIGGSVAV